MVRYVVMGLSKMSAVIAGSSQLLSRYVVGFGLVIFLSACAKVDFVDADGNGYSLSSLQGKYVFVNYWATWCAPCIKEIPELNKLSREHTDDLIILGVDFDQVKGEELKKEIAKMNITFPVFAIEPSKLLDVEIPRVLPTTYVFDREGKLKATLVGPQTEDSLLALVD
ncbi:TlpA family protein disulfide reductase [Pseudomonadales bacterium]|nr:TlpA family protein disulfide reductase [Gammaproteobacteria bacterium]MBT3707966.1 TlpA family protein disulfide reductase [Gammaproteobacteria bacterium]MBT3735611.1 TlpA family protein disulfide reductase [Gammaproteobacteria bacterium]MBT7541941.1 TlpA family protein disulfide reductase [Gammaproteobacteria bacterium]MDC1478247.1 TlpA family protein disulfide reductase [Pseudomonadales bacterium]